MLIRFIQVVRCMGSCIFTAEDISQFNQSPIIRYFGCLQFGAITNKAAMMSQVQIFVWMFSLLWERTKSLLVQSGLSWWFKWWRICMQCKRPRFDPWVRKIAWRREGQPTAIFWPREFSGQRSLAGYTPWGCKESHTTERLILLFSLLIQSMICIFRFLRNCQGVHQGCILSPCLFNLYAEYIIWNARLDESQAGIKIAREKYQ